MINSGGYVMAKKRSERRTFQETYFWVFVGCIILTIVLDHYNISVKESTEYATGIIKKTVENVNQLILWAFPTLLTVKKAYNEWLDRYFEYKTNIATKGEQINEE